MEGDILTHEEIAAERRDLLRYVKALRKAIAELRPAEMRHRALPSAMSEIGLIVETTEQAANEIMQAVEEIMALPQAPVEDYRAMVDENCLRVLAACSFQDLAGQRMSKVVEVLLKLELKVAAIGQLMGEGEEEPEEPEQFAREGDSILLNGPVAPGEGVDQSEIDALFA
jgi:chemotaxis protein CheZ